MEPVLRGPFADVVPSTEDATALDVTHFDDVLVLGEDVPELLAGRTVPHGAVDVLQDLGGVPWALAEVLLDLLSDSDSLHRILAPFFPSQDGLSSGAETAI